MSQELRSAQFRREREPALRELDRLVARAEARGVQSLTAPELTRLPALYRAGISALSVARAISLDANLLEYLDSLAARAYMVVYGTRRPFGEAARAFFRESFPAAVRTLRGPILLAAALLALGGVAGFVLVERDPETFYAIVPAELAGGRTPAADAETLRASLYDEGHGQLQTFATYLFVHNTQVGLLSFALGVVLGLPTLLLMLFNGLILGAFAQIHHAQGLAPDFWGWLLPHGVPELSAVVFCGGAGLSLASAVLLPGERTRARALVEAGRPAGTLVLGAAVLLAGAGLIEGVFRQTVHDMTIRYGLAVVGAVLLGWWVLAPWRRGRA